MLIFEPNFLVEMSNYSLACVQKNVNIFDISQLGPG